MGMLAQWDVAAEGAIKRSTMASKSSVPTAPDRIRIILLGMATQEWSEVFIANRTEAVTSEIARMFSAWDALGAKVIAEHNDHRLLPLARQPGVVWYRIVDVPSSLVLARMMEKMMDAASSASLWLYFRLEIRSVEVVSAEARIFADWDQASRSEHRVIAGEA